MNFPYSPTDMFDYAPMTKADTQIFTGSTFTGTPSWQTWYKPRGATMCHMMAIAGGGGGGGGFTRASGNGGGGGGGACSGISRLIIPAFYLPDILYVLIGQGGIGASGSGVAGGAGTNSFIAFGHTAAAPNVLLASGINAPGGGGAGTGAAAGSAGTIPTISTTNTPQFIGHWFATVGIIGALGGGTGAVGVPVTAWAALPLSPGGGGAGTSAADFLGGGQTATAAIDWGNRNWPTTAGFLAPGGATGAINGSSGVNSLTPFFHTGGAGGAGINLTAGGAGGNGGIGCGGGGGGSGTTGGRGGNGGSGFVSIISW